VRIGLLHPGEMGVTVGQSLLESGHEVMWAASGRSEDSQQRAVPFSACATLSTMCATVEAIMSVCPPHAAADQAQQVVAAGFSGLYVDANAVAPTTSLQIAALFGSDYVDGGIIGPPALQPGTTRLYLSGPHAQAVAAWFSAGALQALAMDGAVSAASSLKMAYAAYTKGNSALLLAVNALAEQAGVHKALQQEWDISQPGLNQRSERAASGTSRKAWRFVGEMEEIAATFAGADLPAGFHEAAAIVYKRMATLKHLPPVELSVVLAELLDDGSSA
jgi:3-hydroxyisobutyrate dehydrogenase-like beta-hydroxyacid dehydrogenase